MSEVISVASEGSGASDGFGVMANLNDGFLGTGYTSSVELSFIAMALIFGYVAFTTFRYLFPETRFLNAVVAALGLRGS